MKATQSTSRAGLMAGCHRSPASLIEIRPSVLAAALALLLGLLPAAAPAQDLKKDLPPPVPRLVKPGGTNEPPEQLALPKVGALPDEFVVLKELKGVVLVPNASLVKPGPFTARPGLDTTRVPMLPQEAMTLIAPSFIGQPVSRASLERIAMTVRLTLAQLGYPFVSAYLPPQDITEGWVQIVVQVSVAASEAKVDGAKYFSTNLYRAAIRQQPGQPINANELREDVDWLNRNPFRYTSFVTAPGQEPGTTAIELRTQERFPLRGNVGYNNTGSLVSDEDRLTAGLAWGNAFGLGHQMSYQFSTSPDFKTSVAHSGSYAMDLPWRHSLRLTGAYSELVGRVAAPLTLNGRSWQVGLRYDIPLPKPRPNVTQNLSLGLDFKESDNNLLFATIPVTDNLTHVAQLALSYDLGFSDEFGRTDFGLNAFLSPGGLTSRNDQRFYDISRAGSHPDYAYVQLSASRQTRLPLDLNWSARAQFQKSTANLLGSEQMAGGGSGSVRGYEEGEVYGDNGVLLSHELALPAFSLAERFGFKQPGDSLQLFGFQDFAVLWSTDRLAGERHYTDLHSIGVGCRYNVRQNLSVNFTHGWQLRDSHVSRSGDNSRSHLSVQASF